MLDRPGAAVELDRHLGGFFVGLGRLGRRRGEPLDVDVVGRDADVQGRLDDVHERHGTQM